MIRKHRLGLRAVQANSRLEEKRDRGTESSLSVSIDSKKDKKKENLTSIIILRDSTTTSTET